MRVAYNDIPLRNGKKTSYSIRNFLMVHSKNFLLVLLKISIAMALSLTLVVRLVHSIRYFKNDYTHK